MKRIQPIPLAAQNGQAVFDRVHLEISLPATSYHGKKIRRVLERELTLIYADPIEEDGGERLQRRDDCEWKNSQL